MTFFWLMTHLKALIQCSLIGCISDGWSALEQCVAIRHILLVEGQIVWASFNAQGQPCKSIWHDNLAV